MVENHKIVEANLGKAIRNGENQTVEKARPDDAEGCLTSATVGKSCATLCDF